MPFVAVNGTQLYVQEAGPSHGRPALLLHAALQTGESMAPLARLLAPHGWRVVMPDQRGHGRSPNPAGALSISQLADDAQALMAALGLDRPLVMGFSLGGIVSVELARRGLVSALTVLAGRMSPPAQGRKLFDPDYLQERMPRWTAGLALLHAATPWDQLARWVGVALESWPAHDPAALGRLAIPALVLQGDKDAMVPVAQAQALAAAIPGARLAIMPHVGHPDLLYREPALQTIREFVARLG